MTKTTLTKATVKDLRKLAKMMGLKGYSKMRKAALVEFILSNIVEVEESAPVQEQQIAINFDAIAEESVKEVMNKYNGRYSFPMHELKRAMMSKGLTAQQAHEAINNLWSNEVISPAVSDSSCYTEEEVADWFYPEMFGVQYKFGAFTVKAQVEAFYAAKKVA